MRVSPLGGPVALPKPGRLLVTLVGPGLIMMALAQGSGELIWWPYLVSRYGLAFLCLIIPAALLQWPVNYAIGLYTLSTGETVLRGFIRWRPVYGLLIWLSFTVAFLWFGAYATAGGTALAELTGLPRGWEPMWQSRFWALVSIAILGGALFVSGGAYRLIELIMSAVSIATVVALIGATFFREEVLATGPAFWSSVIPGQPLQRPWRGEDATVLITAIMFTGLGGFWNLFYSDWILRKKWGAAAETFSESAVELPEGKALDPQAPEGAERFRSWRRVLTWDSCVGISGNLFTTLLLCWLGFVYLTPNGSVPNGWKLAVTQAALFEGSLGAFGRLFFLVVAALFLADGWMTAADSVARFHADAISVLAKPRGWRVLAGRRLYFVLVAALVAVTMATLFIEQPGDLILVTGPLNAGGMVMVCVGLLGVHAGWSPGHLPPWARAGRPLLLLLWLCLLAYAGLFAWFLGESFL